MTITIQVSPHDGPVLTGVDTVAEFNAIYDAASELNHRSPPDRKACEESCLDVLADFAVEFVTGNGPATMAEKLASIASQDHGYMLGEPVTASTADAYLIWLSWYDGMVRTDFLYDEVGEMAKPEQD